MMNIDVAPSRPNLPRNVNESFDEQLLLNIILFGAFYPNYFVKLSNPDLEKQAQRLLLDNDPTSTVYLHGFPSSHCDFGELYRNQITQLFVPVANKSMINSIQFADKKVLVNFRKDFDEGAERLAEGKRSEKCRGDSFVPTAVRRSLKLGKLLR